MKTPKTIDFPELILGSGIKPWVLPCPDCIVLLEGLYMRTFIRRNLRQKHYHLKIFLEKYFGDDSGVFWGCYGKCFEKYFGDNGEDVLRMSLGILSVKKINEIAKNS